MSSATTFLVSMPANLSPPGNNFDDASVKIDMNILNLFPDLTLIE
jgi:hypothetical protein